MKLQVVVLFFLLQAVAIGCAEVSQTDGNNEAQSQMEVLTARLVKSEIGQVEILQIPALVETPIAVTPKQLEKHFDYKLTLSHIQSAVYRDELIRAMKSVSVQPQPEMPDLRWGIIFYDLNGNCSGAIYFDKWGRTGAIGEVPVSFRGDLFKWLNKNFSKCFR